MTQIMTIVTWLMANYQNLITAIVAVLTATLALCTIIPGVNKHIDVLQKVVAFLQKINVK